MNDMSLGFVMGVLFTVASASAIVGALAAGGQRDYHEEPYE